MKYLYKATRSDGSVFLFHAFDQEQAELLAGVFDPSPIVSVIRLH